MTRLLLITLLFLSSSPVYAEWVSLGESDAGTAYADPDTIRRKGNLAKTWYLLDYKTIHNIEGVSFLSGKVQYELNCAETRARILAVTFFPGQMGSGHVVHFESNETKWSPVVPGSGVQALWKFACGKK